MILEFAALVSLRVVCGRGAAHNLLCGVPPRPLGDSVRAVSCQHGRDLLEVAVLWVCSGLRRGGRGGNGDILLSLSLSL